MDIRIGLQARLDGARIAIQIDIGFGDAVTPGAQAVQALGLLPEVPALDLRAHPKATVVAEKTHAISVLGMTSSRMKDFFDLWVLLQDESLEGSELHAAIVATFARHSVIARHCFLSTRSASSDQSIQVASFIIPFFRIR